MQKLRKVLRRDISASESTHLTASNLPPRGLRIQQAANYSGLTCWNIRTAIWSGKLAARTGGKFLVILKDDLDFYLESLPLAEQNNAEWLKARREKSAETAEPEQVSAR
jgi:hypothetical protein